MSRPVTPVPGPVEATVRPPGSKSETIRALAVAALAEGRSHLYGALVARDPMSMVRAMRAFGVEVDVTEQPWRVQGSGGDLDAPSTAIDADESGLTARICVAIAATIEGTSTIAGRGRLPQRPMGGLVEALRTQGAEVVGETLPLEVTGRHPLWGGRIPVDCSRTSQHATAVMLIAPLMAHAATVEPFGLRGSAGYLGMTAATMRRFGASVDETITGYEIANQGYQAADVVVEVDASAAVYPMAVAAATGGRVTVEGLGRGSLQPDLALSSHFSDMGCVVRWVDDGVVVEGPSDGLVPLEADMSHAPDGAMALAVVCMFARGRSRLSGLSSLRDKESDRLEALREEMTRLGAKVETGPDWLLIEGGGDLAGAEVDSHGDHRVAMSLAVAGTVLPGVSVARPEAVDKTWPGFWEFIDALGR